MLYPSLSFPLPDQATPQKQGALRAIFSRRIEAQFANPHKHTSTFAHFYPQQWFLYHTGLYQFKFFKANIQFYVAALIMRCQ
jgi:hypothetical protein